MSAVDANVAGPPEGRPMTHTYPPIVRQDLRIVARRVGPPVPEAAAVADDPYIFDVVASDESLDTFGTSLRGWRLDHFTRNPVVLYAHDHAEPVGQARDVALVDGALRMTIVLAEAGTSSTVDKVRSLRRQGILRGVSVGCMPGELKVEKDAAGREVVVLADNELLEVSVCSVPANGQALAAVRALA